MLTQTRLYRPAVSLNQAQPVKFEVSPAHLHVTIGQPYTKLASRLSHLRFSEDTLGFERMPVVKVFGGTGSDLYWEIALTPEDGADLKAAIAQVLDAASKL